MSDEAATAEAEGTAEETAPAAEATQAAEEAAAVADEAAGAEASDADPGTGDRGDSDMPLVVIDPSEDARLQASGLADDVGRAISALDPGAFGVGLMADLAEAVAIVVEWDLGGRLGIDFVESLQRCEQTAGVPVLLASPCLTPARVHAGLALGARGFVTKPYDAAEIAARLAALPPRS